MITKEQYFCTICGSKIDREKANQLKEQEQNKVFLPAPLDLVEEKPQDKEQCDKCNKEVACVDYESTIGKIRICGECFTTLKVKPQTATLSDKEYNMMGFHMFHRQDVREFISWCSTFGSYYKNGEKVLIIPLDEFMERAGEKLI